MTRRLILLAALAVTCTVAVQAEAAQTSALFKLSISGTAHAEWDHTGAPTRFEGCERTVRTEGIRDVRFKTRSPALVQVLNGRISAATVRRLTGTVTLGGANTTTNVCTTGEGSQAIADCARTTRTFRTATVAVVGGRAGQLTVRPVRNTHLSTSTCPREVAEVLRAPLGPVPGPIRFSRPALANEGFARITLTASKTRTVTYGSPQSGRIEHRSAWKFTLVRVDD